MKYLSIALLVIILCLKVFSQKMISSPIYKNTTYHDYVDALYFYDENDSIDKIEIKIYGRDNRYLELFELVTVYRGNIKSTIKFIDDVYTFFKSNPERTTKFIEGRSVYTIKMSSLFSTVSGFYVNEYNGDGYHGYNEKTWMKIRKSITEWADKNKMSYK